MNEYILDIDKRNDFIKNIQNMVKECKRNKTMLAAIKYMEKSRRFIKYYNLSSVIYIQVNSIKEEFNQIKNLEKLIENINEDRKIVCKNENFYNFLIITFYESAIYIEMGSSKYLELNSKKEIEIEYSSFYRKGYYQFKDEYSIEARNRRGYYYPLTLKAIEQSNFLFYIFFRKYFLVLAKENLLIKDLLKEYTNKDFLMDVPIAFSLLKEAKNKKHLLEIKVKYKVPASLNKYPLSLSYTFLKSIKYLKYKEDIPKLMEFVKVIFNKNSFKNILTRNKEIEKIKNFFKIYFCFTLKVDSYKERIIEDYINLCFLEKRKINLKIKSYKRIENEHNELAMKNGLRGQRLEIRKDNPFLKLKFPDEFEMIKDVERLYQEGVLNRNCVFSYLDYINSGKCMIYSTIYEEERHTIEIGIEDNKFILKQIMTYANSEANSKLVKEIKKILEKESQKLC